MVQRGNRWACGQLRTQQLWNETVRSWNLDCRVQCTGPHIYTLTRTCRDLRFFPLDSLTLVTRNENEEKERKYNKKVMPDDADPPRLFSITCRFQIRSLFIAQLNLFLSFCVSILFLLFSPRSFLTISIDPEWRRDVCSTAYWRSPEICFTVFFSSSSTYLHIYIHLYVKKRKGGDWVCCC